MKKLWGIFLLGWGFFILGTPGAFWKKVFYQDGIEVFKKIPAKEGLYEIRARGLLHASLERTLSLIQNVYFMKHWVSGVQESKMLYRNFNNQSYELPIEKMFTVFYARVKIQWPIQDRDFVLKATVQKIEKGLLIRLTPTHWPNVPVKSNAIRMKRIYIKVFLFQISKQSTWMDYRIYANPEGAIPDFLTNLLIPRESYKTLKALRYLLKVTQRFPEMEALIHHKLQASLKKEP